MRKYICMKYICRTKYIHCFTANKYTKSFLITKLTIGHPSKPYSTIDTSLGVTILNRTKGRSKESSNQGIKVKIKINKMANIVTYYLSPLGYPKGYIL